MFSVPAHELSDIAFMFIFYNVIYKFVTGFLSSFQNNNLKLGMKLKKSGVKKIRTSPFCTVCNDIPRI